LKNIIILLGKSASGKDTILKELNKILNYNIIVSWTSRPIRDNETQDLDYHFVTKEKFISEIPNLVEYRTYNTLLNGNSEIWYYGIHKSSLKNNSIVITDLDGYKSLEKYSPKAFYINVPDNIRTERAKKRASFSLPEWNRRLQDDNIKFSQIPKDIKIIKNDNITTTIDEILKILGHLR